MRILITGSNGLLGQHLVSQLIKRKTSFLATSKGENRNSKCPKENYSTLDITDSTVFETLLDQFHPTHVIHTAAITNVDFCELNPEECELINVFAVKQMFQICEKRNVHFQLLSTDFVFDGENGPYKETDLVNPLSVYAKSKVEGENYLFNSTSKNWSIARTIIVYGPGENLSRGNLIEWALDALPKQQPMQLVNDQFRAPTWVGDLAWGCLRICELNENGVFHLSGPQSFSIVNIVKRIAVHCNYSTAAIEEISSYMLSQPAKRPPKTGFILEKANKVLNYSPKEIEETIDILRTTYETRTNF